jgi:hypothetical protein
MNSRLDPTRGQLDVRRNPRKPGHDIFGKRRTDAPGFAAEVGEVPENPYHEYHLRQQGMLKNSPVSDECRQIQLKKSR